MKRIVVEPVPAKSANGFAIEPKKRIDMESYSKNTFPNVQITLLTNQEEDKHVVSQTVVVPLDSLVLSNFKINYEGMNATITFAWQDELPPGLTTGRKAATNLLDVFASKEEFANWSLRTGRSNTATYCQKIRTDAYLCSFLHLLLHTNAQLGGLIKNKSYCHTLRCTLCVENWSTTHPSVVHGTLQANELDLSHLCHTATCINADHLHFEPKPVNESRETCGYARHCKGHGQYPKSLTKSPHSQWAMELCHAFVRGWCTEKRRLIGIFPRKNMF